jgi:AcrR family transcriptional regulator
LIDAAIELLGEGGQRGLSHAKVDARAQVPPGTTSAYYRTRRFLLRAVAERLAELDTADLARLSDPPADAPGTAHLARLVMAAASEPWLTRAKARYELLLASGRDPELAAALQDEIDVFFAMSRRAVAQWRGVEGDIPDRVVDEITTGVLAAIGGVMVSFTSGRPLVDDAEALQRMLDALIVGTRRQHEADD